MKRHTSFRRTDGLLSASQATVRGAAHGFAHKAARSKSHSAANAAQRALSLVVTLALCLQLVPTEAVRTALATETETLAVEEAPELQVVSLDSSAGSSDNASLEDAVTEDAEPYDVLASERAVDEGETSTSVDVVAVSGQDVDSGDVEATDAESSSDAGAAAAAEDAGTTAAADASLGQGRSLLMANAAGTPVHVSTWAELIQAVEEAKAQSVLHLTIEVEGDLTAPGAEVLAIEDGLSVTIVGTGAGATITKGSDFDGNLSLVQVSGGMLTLGHDVTWQGKPLSAANANGKIDESRALFAHVSGGTLNIAGATITGFVSENVPGDEGATIRQPMTSIGLYSTDSAPIVVEAGGSLNMTSGSISNNKVGYPFSAVEERIYGGDYDKFNSSEGTDGSGAPYANISGKIFNGDNYDKSGTKLRRTNTSGAILVNGGTATISGGTIANNKGDAGAISIVSGGKVTLPAGEPIGNIDSVSFSGIGSSNGISFDYDYASFGFTPTGRS